MKKIALILIAFTSLISAAHALIVSIVSHHWMTKIVDSRNNVTIRPGSVYEINTYFEEILSGFTPKFKYIFRDTGLGTADPIYPIYQEGYQKSWSQMIPALWSEKERHIDHYSKVDTPEGCTVYSAYWVRHIDEFPEKWHQERAEGYTLVDTGFDYYESDDPNAKCGKHKVHPVVPKEQNPIEQLKKYAKSFKGYESIPEEILAKVETKLGLLKLVSEEFSKDKWPRYDEVYNLRGNSLWYYIDGVKDYYGVNQPTQQKDLKNAVSPSDYFIEGNTNQELSIKMSSLITPEDYEKLLKHMKGNPNNNYVKESEPGNDHFSIDQVDENFHIYTRGLDLWPIKNAEKTLSNSDNFKFVSMVIRPYQEVDDYSFESKIQPEMRFVFQLNDPESKKLSEQAFIHLIFDGVDRHATDEKRRQQHWEFLKDYDALIGEKKKNNANFKSHLFSFINKYKARGVESINYSNTLTGIWVFGGLTKSYNPNRELQSLSIKRQGIDIGYYSTAWDTMLFRERIKESNDEKEQKLLEEHVDALTPHGYRDQRRHDVNKITFNKMTCAQCHQMSGRDGVHMALNDDVDERVKTPTRATEFMIRELKRQLEFGQSYWK